MKCYASRIHLITYYVPIIRFLLSKENPLSLTLTHLFFLNHASSLKSPFLFLLSLICLKANYTFLLGHLTTWSPPNIFPLLCCLEYTHCLYFPGREHTSICHVSVGVTISAFEMVVGVFVPWAHYHNSSFSHPWSSTSFKPRIFS